MPDPNFFLDPAPNLIVWFRRAEDPHSFFADPDPAVFDFQISYFQMFPALTYFFVLKLSLFAFSLQLAISSFTETSVEKVL